MKNHLSHCLRSALTLLVSLVLILTYALPPLTAFGASDTELTINTEDGSSAAADSETDADDEDVSESQDAETTSSYTDGVYEGTGRGHKSNIVVRVTISGGEISAIEIVSQNETPSYWKKLENEDGTNIITQRMIEAQSSDVDAVSGATRSSNGIKSAVADALQQASGSTDPYDPSEDDPDEIDEDIFAYGSGTAEDPYVIINEDQLRAFAFSLNSKIDFTDIYVCLEKDITLKDGDWEPVGSSFYRFNGDFNGNGHTISGLSEGSSDAPRELDGESAYIGLFGFLGESAHIHDVALDDIAIYTHSSGTAYIGGIAGRADGTETEGDYHGANIDNCSVKGVIEHTTDSGTSFIAGAVGWMRKGCIINSAADMQITAKELSGELVEIGGFAGLLNRGLIANCYAMGSYTGSGYRDTATDTEGMANVGSIAGVSGGYIVNCYAEGDVEALEYSIDTGVIAGWATGISKTYDSWYSLDAVMKIDGKSVDPVDPIGEKAAGGVSDEWGFKFPGALVDNINGYHPESDAQKVADGLNESFSSFPIDIESIYGLSADALRQWTVQDGRAVLAESKANVTYVQPQIEKDIEEEEDSDLQDGTWYGRSEDKTAIVAITVENGELTGTEVLAGDESGDEYDEAVSRAKYKALYGDHSNYEPADTSKFKGSGTEEDPYLIENESQLRYLAASVNEDVDWLGCWFRQTNDITIKGGDWQPIGWGIFADADGDGFGQDLVALYPFRGNYDGADHVISGLKAGSKADPASGNYMGLFGIIQGDYGQTNEIPEDKERASLRNIRLQDVAFYTENRWRSYVGGLSGGAQGGFTIDNCSVTGTVNSRSTEDFAFAGGLTGSLMYGSVTNSWTKADSSSWSASNYSYAAGMSAVSNRATIVNSYAAGDVHADASQTNRAEAGGFIGLDGGVCINCYARGNVESVSKYSMYVGGFVGMAASSSEHRQCYYNTDASQKAAGKDLAEKRYAGKFVNESAEAYAQAKTASEMSSEAFRDTLEDNRTSIAETLSQVKSTLEADENGSSEYHSIYYNGDGSDLNEWAVRNGMVQFKSGAAIKQDQSMSVKVKNITVKRAKLRKKAISFKAKKIFTVKKYHGTLKYKKISGNKKISVSSKGVIKLDKKLKKGTYKVKVRITASGNASYNSASVVKTIKVRVK